MNGTSHWSERIAGILKQLAESRNLDAQQISSIPVVVQKPPKPELGDLAVPLFPFARVFRTSPQQIAEDVCGHLMHEGEQASAAGGYLNIRVDLAAAADELFEQIASLKDSYGHTQQLKGVKAMVEFSCPNTNKPLHLGHLRNDALGESVSRILKANGGDVKKVNLINDRGIHICKSMAAYREFGEGRTPETEGTKSDHFVGEYYVKYAAWEKQDPKAEETARKMLLDWEQSDPDTVELWKTMNRWAVEGIEATYAKTRISFDEVYYESRTYEAGREEVLKGLESGVFYRDEEGTVWVDLEDAGLDKKVLLRKDGTSLYLTQDIGTAILRHQQWPFDMMVYVVGSEQQYHFRVLFHVLGLLGFSWAERMHHLSYGMVNLPEGKMKSREGKVVDADDLIDELVRMAKEEIIEKGREEIVVNLDETSLNIALGALNYYLLQVSPAKDMIFDPKKSIEFTGNTGPYLQYMGARISSMLEKFEKQANSYDGAAPDTSLLVRTDERELIKILQRFPEAVSQAGREKNPSVICAYLYELTSTFSRFYHDAPVLRAETRELAVTRIQLCRAMLQVLKNGCRLLGIPVLETM